MRIPEERRSMSRGEELAQESSGKCVSRISVARVYMFLPSLYQKHHFLSFSGSFSCSPSPPPFFQLLFTITASLAPTSLAESFIFSPPIPLVTLYFLVPICQSKKQTGPAHHGAPLISQISCAPEELDQVIFLKFNSC